MKLENVKYRLLVLLVTILIAVSFFATKKLAEIINPVFVVILLYVVEGVSIPTFVFPWILILCNINLPNIF